MIEVSESISSLGMNTADYGYTTIEMLGNIQSTASVVLIILCGIAWFYKSRSVSENLWDVFVLVLLVTSVTLALSTVIRIWI